MKLFAVVIPIDIKPYDLLNAKLLYMFLHDISHSQKERQGYVAKIFYLKECKIVSSCICIQCIPLTNPCQSFLCHNKTMYFLFCFQPLS